MSNETSENLLIQVRTAHRLLAAYYQRLLPCIEQIAKILDIDFYFWIPKEFARPCQLTTNPFSRWGWDMLPALSTYYVFKNVTDVNQIRTGEYLVEFMIDTDSAVKANSKNGNEPDALNLPISVVEAKSTLMISIYSPYKDENKNWFHYLWNSCDIANISEVPEPKQNNEIPVVSCGFEIPLSYLLQEGMTEKLVERIKDYINATVEHIKSIRIEQH